MVIRESGLIFRGFSLVKKSYHKTDVGKIDEDLRSALMTALLNFAESTFSAKLIEYFELKKFCIAFSQANIQSGDGFEPETLLAYAIIDNEKKMDKYVQKIAKPFLSQSLNQFITDNEGENLSEVRKYQYFKKNLDEIFGSTVKTLDERLNGVLF